MAYDSKTYGQSPFGNPKPPDDQTLGSKPAEKPAAASNTGTPSKPPEKSPEKPPEKSPEKSPQRLSDKLSDKSGSSVGDRVAQSSGKPAEKSKSSSPGLASKFPNLSGSKAGASSSTRKSTSSSSRTSKKSKPAKAKAEAAEQAIAQRFSEEDRSAYLSLLYKTGISGLVWAVLRLSRYELSAQAIALINLIIHPVVIAAVAFICMVALTFWTRQLLNDLARHTQQLHTDAEAPDSKSFRPTLEIVGDALEYNPKLRKNFAQLFNAASILICSLVSYLITFVLFPTDT